MKPDAITAAALADPGELAEPPMHYRNGRPVHYVGANATDCAACLAERLSDAERDARRAERTTYAALTIARTALADAERAHVDAQNAVPVAAAELRHLLRALAHRDETAPHVETHAEYGAHDRTTYAATFGSATVHSRSSAPGWSSKPKPRVAVAYPLGLSGAETLYQSARGTSDPTKLAAEMKRAHDAAIDYVSARTAAAWLRAHGIDPADAPDPAELVHVTAEASPHWYGSVRYYSPHWYLALNATNEPIADGPEITGARELAAALAERAGTYDRATVWDGPPRHGDTEDDARAYAEAHAAEALPELVARL